MLPCLSNLSLRGSTEPATGARGDNDTNSHFPKVPDFEIAGKRKSVGSDTDKESLTNDPERQLLLETILRNGYALQFASANLRADRDVVLAAVSQDGYALQFASDDLKADRDVVLAAVSQNAFALEYASDDLKADREFVLAVVSQDGYALQFASANLRADREFVLSAVSRNGFALLYVPNGYDNTSYDFEMAAATAENLPRLDLIEKLLESVLKNVVTGLSKDADLIDCDVVEKLKDDVHALGRSIQRMNPGMKKNALLVNIIRIEASLGNDTDNPCWRDGIEDDPELTGTLEESGHKKGGKLENRLMKSVLND